MKDRRGNGAANVHSMKRHRDERVYRQTFPHLFRLPSEIAFGQNLLLQPKFNGG